PFANNAIPAARQSRVAQQLISWLPQPTTSALTSNYFGTGSSSLDRNAFDGKLNWNKSDKWTVFGRFSILNFTTFSPTPFDQASGQSIDTSQQAGPGQGRIISSAIGTNYIVSPTFLLDGNVAYTRIAPGTHPIQYGQNIGLDVLKLPGTNGPTIFESGIPEFQVSGYETLGNPGSATPYFWHDQSYQYNVNATWTKGAHNVRFGVDISRQDMNHLTAEQGAGPRGTFQFTGGVTALKGGVAPNQFNSYAAFLLGLPSTVGKTVPVEAPVTTRAWSQGYYIRDQWQARRNLTITYGVRYEYYPIPTRDHRGLERYDLTQNKVIVGGIGDVPTNMGVSDSPHLLFPRVGIAYRPTEKWVLRAGYGINADPYSLARPFRTNYPVLVDQNFVSPNSYAYVSRTEDGIPPVPVPTLGNGVIDIPGTVSAKTLDTDFRRGYVESFNFTVQREITPGLSAQVGFVGTRGIRQQVSQELNWAPIGAGNTGRVLNQEFGRVASTLLQAPFGTANYNALQAHVNRRFGTGFTFQASYTFSKAIAYADEADSTLAFNIPSSFGRDRSVTTYDRTHNVQAGFLAESPFGKGKHWFQTGLGNHLLGGWQLNGTFSAYSGTPFSVTASGASLNAPTETQTADQILPTVNVLGGTGPGQSYFDPAAFAPVTAVRYGTSGLDILRGPGVANVDLGIFRQFSITERWKMQFRAEAFNAANTPHFNNPGTNVSNAIFNSNGTIGRTNGYTEITSAQADQRQLRFGLRFSF
ncbi:MAG: TonB-dependent receptor domain-containing protein, partial [Bryobacteraceae bacterium]